MTVAQRVALVVCGLVVAAFAAVLGLFSWDRASQVAGVVSALVSVAALGASVWAALATNTTGGRIRAARTGRAVARSGGSANTGVMLSASGGSQSGEVSRTGDAESDGGQANTGVVRQ